MTGDDEEKNKYSCDDENMLEREESDRVEDIFVPCRDSRAQSVLIKVSGMLKAKNKHWMER